MEILSMASLLVFLVVLVVLGGIGYGVYFVITQRLQIKAKPTEVLIVTGPKLGDPEKDSSIYVGMDEKGNPNGKMVKVARGGHRRRRFQVVEKIELNVIQIKINTTAHAGGEIQVEAEGTATISVGEDNESIIRFAEKLGAIEPSQRKQILTNILEDNFRAVITETKIDKLYSDKETFKNAVKTLAEPEIAALGMKIDSIGLSELRDVEKNGYISNLGRATIETSRELAEKAQSDANRNIENHKLANDLEQKRKQVDANKEKSELEKQLKLTEAENKKVEDTARANSDLAYDLEKEKLNKALTETRLANELDENQRKLSVDKARNDLRLQELEIKKAEDKAQAEIEAQRKQIEEETQARIKQIQVETERKVTETKAKAEATRKTEEAKARATEIEAIGLAEAKAEEEKGKAKAKSITLIGTAEATALREKAEALNLLGEAGKLEMILNVLPQFAEAIARPLSNIDDVKIIDMGNGEGLNALPTQVTKNVTAVQEVLQATTGLNLTDLMTNVSKLGANQTVVNVEKGAQEQNSIEPIVNQVLEKQPRPVEVPEVDKLSDK
ncbi:flotillin domain-containing protein [Ureibacillus composti]|nr:flotillin domain-containing protein [Ureibacillus composti]